MALSAPQKGVLSLTYGQAEDAGQASVPDWPRRNLVAEEECEFVNIYPGLTH